jgi:hypothetical protein
MSTASGLAAVTAVLKDLLINGLIDHDATAAVGDVLVTAQAPDRIVLPETKSQLNLFLYLVTPNQGWRNVGYPARDSRGDLIAAPPLALDLHYLLTAYGAKDFHAEILLGYAMQLFHEMQVLSRPAIRAALAPSLNVTNGDVPADLRDLFLSGIADQVEQIKVCQTFLTTEEMFKLWMAFQTAYRPTAAYHVSVLLLESKRQGKSAPPVRRFGVSATQLRQPVLVEVRSRAQAADPFTRNRIIVPGDEVAVIGDRLKGETTKVFAGETEITAADGLVVADDQITFRYETRLRPGIQPVSVTHLLQLGDPPAPHSGVVSNAVPLVLSPRLVSITATITSGQGGNDATGRAGSFTVNISPAVGQTQSVSLLLNEFDPPDSATRPPRGYRLTVPPRTQVGAPATTTTLTVPFTGLLPATYVARIRIDGAESPLGLSAGGVYNAPAVAIT